MASFPIVFYFYIYYFAFRVPFPFRKYTQLSQPHFSLFDVCRCVSVSGFRFKLQMDFDNIFVCTIFERAFFSRNVYLYSHTYTFIQTYIYFFDFLNRFRFRYFTLRVCLWCWKWLRNRTYSPPNRNVLTMKIAIVSSMCIKPFNQIYRWHGAAVTSSPGLKRVHKFGAGSPKTCVWHRMTKQIAREQNHIHKVL